MTTGLAFIEECFHRNADRPCLTCLDDTTLSYGALWQRAEQYGRRLGELGVRQGDRVLIRLENSEHILSLYLACARCGFVACPVDAELPEGRASAVAARAKPAYRCTEATFGEWTSPPTSSAPVPASDEENRPFLTVMSSGTTGGPKDIVLGIKVMVESARSFAALAGHTRDTVVYHHFPMFYMAGIFNLFFCPLVSGARIVLGPRFSSATMTRFWERPRRHRVNHLTLTPTMAASLAQLYRPDGDLLDHLNKYEGVFSTGSLLYDAVAEQFQKAFGVPLQSCYGVTEVGGTITLQSWDQALARDSVGRFRPEVEIAAGTAACADDEIRVRTPFGMSGYWVEGALQRGVDEQGFFRTGDRGYLRDGCLYVTGRDGDKIKKGGEFVALPAIEDLALRSEGVVEATAVAVPDAYWGNKVVLFYVPRTADVDTVERSLLGTLTEGLRKIEVPDKLIPVPAIPRTAVGKALKARLLQRYTV